MPEEKKERVQTTANPAVDRREFFTRMGIGALGIAAAGTVAFGYQFLSPNVLYEPSPVVNMGKPEAYPPDSVTLDVNARIFVVHDKQGFFALSAVCTHLGCLTAWKPEIETIACPCHGSKFTREGVKKEGPAPEPLPWLRMWLSDEGELLVDKDNKIRPMEFVRV